MKGLGAREVVGLGVLAVALVIGFVYLDPASSESRTTPPGEIHLGTTPSPTAVVTPTVAPPTVLGAPGSWIIGFYEAAFSGGNLLVAQSASSKLNLDYAARPFGDVRDDAWSVRAEGSYTLEPGRYVLKLEYQGHLTVTVDGVGAFDGESLSGPQTAVAAFEHMGGTAKVRIEGRDVKGPFRLRLAE